MYANPYYQQYQYQTNANNMPTGQQANNFNAPPKDGKLVVHGEGTVTTPPDTVTLLLGAVTESHSLKEAQQENSNRISAVIETLRNFDISADDIQTVDYRMEPQYDFIDGKQTFRAYQVVHLLNITLSDVNMAGTITDAAVTAGANTIRNIQFSISNSSAIYQQALINAVNDGKTKAASVASSLPINLNPVPTKIEEIIQPDVIPFRPMSLTALEGEGVPLQPGTLEIKARVEMTFTSNCNSIVTFRD
ncbi:MAG: SIMPL domain-containing protein [Bacillaceae bacterium]|nr:SIMPL domain-containing protein [Bacillaceae bacterium]